MQSLNLPACPAKITQKDGKYLIFDPLRRRNVALTPEEWVRQHFVHFLITEKHYPKELIANEVAISLNSLSRRCDTIVYNRLLQPLVIVEYKAASVPISQSVFEQISRYNIVLRVNYLIVSNGLTHYCCKIDYKTGTVTYLQEIPAYSQL